MLRGTRLIPSADEARARERRLISQLAEPHGSKLRMTAGRHDVADHPNHRERGHQETAQQAQEVPEAYGHRQPTGGQRKGFMRAWQFVPSSSRPDLSQAEHAADEAELEPRERLPPGRRGRRAERRGPTAAHGTSRSALTGVVSGPACCPGETLYQRSL
jgi:hypothetical protein